MSGGFFRGTSADQDSRFSNKQAKLLKTHKFPSELDQSVDIAKVKMDVIKPWIATRVTELLGFEDEVLINFIYGLLEGKNMDGKQIQIQLTGFMEKNTSKFMKELWGLLISAQNNSSGVPQQFLDAKQLEIQKKKEESEKIMEEIEKKREKEKAEEESERKNKRADEILIPNQELQDQDSSKLNNNNHNSPSRNSPSRRRRRRSPSPEYRRRRYRSPDLRESSRRFSPSRRQIPPSRRRSPPPQRKRSRSPYERPSQEDYRRKGIKRSPADLAEDSRKITRSPLRGKIVISSKVRTGSPTGSESPDFVPTRSPPQRKRSVSPYGSRGRRVISSHDNQSNRYNRRNESPDEEPVPRARKSEIVRDRKVVSSPRYKRRHESPDKISDEEPVPRSRKSEIVRNRVHEPSPESPDERDNNYNHEDDDYVPRRKSKEEEEYEPRSFKKEQKGKINEFSSDSEFETEEKSSYKGKTTKVKKYSDESSEYESERERKRRDKERYFKKEDKREKHKKKSRVRNEEFEDEESDEKERQKRLEIELREKALQSLRAKKGSSDH